MLVLISGQASGWTTQAGAAEEKRRREAAPPLVQGSSAGVRRWYFWYVMDTYGRVRWLGPLAYTDSEVFDLETSLERNVLGTRTYRFVYSPVSRTWVHDTRPRTSLLMGDSVGAYPTPKVMRGKWTLGKFPKRVRLHGVWFERATWFWPKPGVAAEYREMKARDAMHLFVVLREPSSGRPWLEYVVPHIDEANPDQGLALEHLVLDVLSGGELGMRLLQAPSPRPQAL